MENKFIDEQIEKFEQEILILEGCISTLKAQKLIKQIRKIKNNNGRKSSNTNKNKN